MDATPVQYSKASICSVWFVNMRSGLWLHIIILDCSDMGIIATGGSSGRINTILKVLGVGVALYLALFIAIIILA